MTTVKKRLNDLIDQEMPDEGAAYLATSLVNQLANENQELRETLEWYADEIMAYSITQANEPRSAVHGDRGARARLVLAKYTKE